MIFFHCKNFSEQRGTAEAMPKFSEQRGTAEAMPKFSEQQGSHDKKFGTDFIHLTINNIIESIKYVYHLSIHLPRWREVPDNFIPIFKFNSHFELFPIPVSTLRASIPIQRELPFGIGLTVLAIKYRQTVTML